MFADPARAVRQRPETLLARRSHDCRLGQPSDAGVEPRSGGRPLCVYLGLSSEPVSAIELAEFSRLGTHPFAVEAFGKWLKEAGNPPIDLLDLFCWEQMSGRGQSRIRAEYDIAQESFSPLNNRRLLSVMLSVDTESRRSPDYRLFADLISALWPDVLSEPINPPETTSLARRFINVIKKTGVQRFIPHEATDKVKALFR